jgi:hypothetical protein
MKPNLLAFILIVLAAIVLYRLAAGSADAVSLSDSSSIEYFDAPTVLPKETVHARAKAMRGPPTVGCLRRPSRRNYKTPAAWILVHSEGTVQDIRLSAYTDMVEDNVPDGVIEAIMRHVHLR